MRQEDSKVRRQFKKKWETSTVRDKERQSRSRHTMPQRKTNGRQLKNVQKDVGEKWEDKLTANETIGEA